MKQHITPEQFRELTHKQKKRLVSWWEPKRGDSYYSSHNGKITFHTTSTLKKHKNNRYSWPLLSIGQMIEFLGKEWVDKLAIIGTRDLDNPFYLSETHKLCDALWEAVKEVLDE